MTIVAAVEKNSKVYFGCDSIFGTDDLKDKFADSKFVKFPDLIIGFSGYLRAFQVVKRQLKIRKDIKKTDDWFHINFISSMKDVLRKNGVLVVENEQEKLPSNCNFLIGFKGKIYEMDDDFSMFRSARGFACIGSGSNVALGSLWTTRDLASPQARLRLALEASVELVPSCAPPFFYEEL